MQHVLELPADAFWVITFVVILVGAIRVARDVFKEQ